MVRVPGRPRAELLLIDPYTFTEFEDAMLAILDAPALSRDLRILIDRRGAARPTSSFVGCMVNFFRAHEAQLAGTRAAVLVTTACPNLSPTCGSADFAFGRSVMR